MTNQFTDEQVEAAVNAAWAETMKHRGVGGQVVQAPTFEFIQVVHAALEAAAGVAPQVKKPGRLISRLRDLGSVIEEEGHGEPAEWMYRAADWIDANSGQVQPSSTVDEDALAEVIRRSYENEQGLKIRDDKRTARAVAEWLRGESR